jgi:hypothetical protein
MTLIKAIETMREAGFIQAKDAHSRFFRDLDELLPEAKLDLNDYTPNVQTGEIAQNHPKPSAHYQCN